MIWVGITMNVHLPIARINNNACSPQRKNNTAPSFGAWFKPMEIKDESKLFSNAKWMDDGFSSAMQRFVSGATALLTQPWFDLNNKRVDEDTQKVSCARTIGKIIAGMLTGVTIRWACVELTKKFTKNENTEAHLKEVAEEKGKIHKLKTNFSKWDQWLLPKAHRGAEYKEIKKYRGALGTFAALGVMIFTNFLVDAPVTTYLTNKIVKMFKLKGTEEKEQKSVQGGNQ